MTEIELPLMGTDVDCACGRVHRILTRAIQVEEGVMDRIPALMEAYGMGGRCLIVSDTNTYAAAGQYVEQVLRQAGRPVSSLVIARKSVHADEETLGEIMMAMEPRPDVLIAVGTGSLNDSTRYVARHVGLPYFVVATAASMDGFASTVTPVCKDGIKLTYSGVHPQMVLAEPAVLAAAPMELAAAGFGDILGKRTALMDWTLARDITGEAYCPVVADMMEQAMQACLETAPGLGRRDPSSVTALMKALALSGVAMQMHGNSRPASGVEHHISHFLEMRDLARGKPASLHGDKVGVASLIGLSIYEKFFTEQPPEQGERLEGAAWERAMEEAFGQRLAPRMVEAAKPYFLDEASWAAYRTSFIGHWDSYRSQVAGFAALREQGARALEQAHGPVLPQQMGYTRQDVLDAIRFARFVRPERPTILTWAANWGRLDAIAEEIADALYQ